MSSLSPAGGGPGKSVTNANMSSPSVNAAAIPTIIVRNWRSRCLAFPTGCSVKSTLLGLLHQITTCGEARRSRTRDGKTELTGWKGRRGAAHQESNKLIRIASPLWLPFPF